MGPDILDGLLYPTGVIISVSKVTRDNGIANESSLKKLGWDMPKLSAFGQKIIVAEALVSQDANILQQKEKTIDKNVILAYCHQWLSEAGERVKQTYKKTSAKYAAFPFKQLEEARHSETKMIDVMAIGISYCQANFDDLSGAGHTEEVQALGVSLKDALTDKDHIQEMKKETNQEDTQNRYMIFNELIDIVNKINAAGRKVFRNQPNKLVLFKSPWPRSKKTTPPTPPPPAP